MYEAVEGNIRGTWFLVIGFILVVAALGYVFGQLTGFGYWGVAVAGVIAAAGAWGSYYYSDQLVLSISGAHPADREQYPHLYNTVEGLAIAAGVSAPKVYLIDDTAPNAFATGRDPEHAAVAVTTGLLDKLNRLELEGVIAHEMSHIQNYDIRVATLTAVLVGLVALLSDWLLRSMRWGRRRGNREEGSASGVFVLVGIALAILAPLFAQLMRLAISRRREFLADASGAMLTRYPEGLASALQKITADPEPLEVANKATAHLYIINPLREWGGWANSLFDTHPPVEERVRRLREMEAGAAPQAGAAQPTGGSMTVALIVAVTGFFVLSTGPAWAQSQPVAGGVHRVAAGDTLWSLARRFGTTPDRLAAMNGISLESILSIGQPLKVPARPVQLAQPAQSARPAGPAQSATVEIYRIQPGDTLWSIARRYSTKPDRIAAMNGISVDGILKIGQELKVRAPADVAPGAATRARLASLPSRGEHWASSIVALSTRHVGARYRWGGTSPAGFDCSGFLYYVFGQMGVALPRTTYAMYDAGVPVPQDELQAGDLVFFQTLSPGPSHAGIYMGDGRFIHAESGSGRVMITSMDDSYYAPRYLGARRF